MKCFSRFVVLALTGLFLIGLTTSEMAEAATYGSGRKSFSSSSSSSRRSSFSSGSSSRSSSSLFNSNRNSSSKPSGYNSGSSYNGQSNRSSVNFDRDASTAKKSAASSSSNSGGPKTSTPWPSTSGSGTRNHFSSGYGATPTPTPAPVVTPRQRAFGSFTRYPRTNYRDRYDSAFWWWLLSRPREERAQWAYHHTGDMDPARYQAMMQADQGLQEQVTSLELEKVPANPVYTPPGVEKDLMYSLELEAPVDYAVTEPPRSGRIWFWLWTLAGGGFLIWLVFVKRWQVAPALR